MFFYLCLLSNLGTFMEFFSFYHNRIVWTEDQISVVCHDIHPSSLCTLCFATQDNDVQRSTYWSKYSVVSQKLTNLINSSKLAKTMLLLWLSQTICQTLPHCSALQPLIGYLQGRISAQGDPCIHEGMSLQCNRKQISFS